VAIDALRTGKGLPTFLNAANEIAVEAFLNRLISFHEIAHMVEEACNSALADGLAHEPESVSDALAMDRAVRERSRFVLTRQAASRAGVA
jgi:1-deoxy-D-xylulose-5-phosphate reductoisomerase